MIVGVLNAVAPPRLRMGVKFADRVRDALPKERE